MSERIDALILDSRERGSLAVARALGPSGYRLAMGGYSARDPGLFTRYAHLRTLFTPPARGHRPLRPGDRRLAVGAPVRRDDRIERPDGDRAAAPPRRPREADRPRRPALPGTRDLAGQAADAGGRRALRRPDAAQRRGPRHRRRARRRRRVRLPVRAEAAHVVADARRGNRRPCGVRAADGRRGRTPPRCRAARRRPHRPRPGVRDGPPRGDHGVPPRRPADRGVRDGRDTHMAAAGRQLGDARVDPAARGLPAPRGRADRGDRLRRATARWSSGGRPTDGR